MGFAASNGPRPRVCKHEEVHILERGVASVKMIRREVRDFFRKNSVILVTFVSLTARG